ncbi:MAG: 6-carboxytetrahydropterin synthase [Planctomycetia bacterium]|nr:6-carboxytetrahydropterin synthase [Planctomycetia bacterium]
MKTYKIRIQNDSLTFSSAHFITFSSGECETLHGHDFHVSLEMEAGLEPLGKYIIDFIQLQNAVRDIIRELDHKVLLAGESPVLQLMVQQKEPEVSADIHGWISSVGKWLATVNDYQDDVQQNVKNFEELAQEKERELECYLERELGMPHLPDACLEEEKSDPDDGKQTEHTSGVLRAEVDVRYGNKRWVFPEEDCIILPVENTTAEMLADYLLQKLLKHPLLAGSEPDYIKLELTESVGMSGICEYYAGK